MLQNGARGSIACLVFYGVLEIALASKCTVSIKIVVDWMSAEQSKPYHEYEWIGFL